jgi:hypothetical protein
LLYSEWIMRCSSCFTSAWKPRVSFVVIGRVGFLEVRSAAGTFQGD